MTPRSAIELRHLYYFANAAEHGAFRRAAAALGVQESTISRAVRDLEDDLGASLFHRHIGGVRLTFAGERFLQCAKSVLQRVSEGAQDVAAIGSCGGGLIKIGVFSSLAFGFLAELIRRFDEKFGDVQVNLVDGDPGDHLAAVHSLQLDVAFVVGTSGWQECEAEVLWSERVFAVLPRDHELSARDVLNWRDLEAETLIFSEGAPSTALNENLLQYLADAGRPLDIKTIRVGHHNLLSLVAIERGLTLTSESTTASSFPGVVYRPVADETLPFSAVWSSRNSNPALRCLLSLARSMSKGASSTSADRRIRS